MDYTVHGVAKSWAQLSGFHLASPLSRDVTTGGKQAYDPIRSQVGESMCVLAWVSLSRERLRTDVCGLESTEEPRTLLLICIAFLYFPNFPQMPCITYVD